MNDIKRSKVFIGTQIANNNAGSGNSFKNSDVTIGNSITNHNGNNGIEIIGDTTININTHYTSNNGNHGFVTYESYFDKLKEIIISNINIESIDKQSLLEKLNNVQETKLKTTALQKFLLATKNFTAIYEDVEPIVKILLKMYEVCTT